jgi:hypothetical protein
MPSSEIHQKARGFAVTARVALINQLPPDRLNAVVQLLEFLAQPAQGISNPEETALLEVIQWHLPENEQIRLQELRASAALRRNRCEWEQLTESEHEELLCYEDLLEQRRVDRLKALIDLAKLRNIDLMTLNRQFQSESQPFHAA